jgi:hypothetical protein
MYPILQTTTARYPRAQSLGEGGNHFGFAYGNGAIIDKERSTVNTAARPLAADLFGGAYCFFTSYAFAEGLSGYR